MNISGIVVTTAPAHVPEVAAALAALPFVEVTHCDAATGRIVVVQERENTADEMDGLRAMQSLPNVLGADLAAHYFGDEERPPLLPVAELARHLEQRAPAIGPGRQSDPDPDSWRAS